MFKRLLIIFYVWLYTCIFITAQIPANYYNSAIGKQSSELKTALHQVINKHISLSYIGLSSTFKTTDWHPNGYFWDMYSEIQRSYWSDLNREHCMPKSWFAISSGNEDQYPIGCDVNNLFPSDENVNSAKSDYALGVAGNSAFLSNSNCKVGANTYPGYPGTVFEPANEYKGDFARTYMYMVTCYEDYANVWRNTGTLSMLQRNTYPVFNAYAIKLLLEWHRSDPVSSKEINRNNAVYSLQQNRNPFIDYPLLAEYIWGKFMGEIWDGTSDEPESAEPLVFKFDKVNQTMFVKLKKPTNAYFKIYSISGILKQNGTFTSSSKFDLKDGNTGQKFEKGVYLFSVYAGGRRKTERIMIY